MKHYLFIFLFLFITFIFADSSNNSLIELSVLHINDFHSRYEELSIDSGICKRNNCIGGFSRLYASINKHIEKNPNSILLNAGDNFEGTLWYDVHKWNATQFFMNKLPIDAFTLGNHEFEDKISGLIPFLQHLKAPVVVANIDISKEPSLDGLYNKSVIIKKKGLKIGIIGVLTSTTKELANVGNIKFLPESESVNNEARRLVEEEGVFTNIVLSHCGYDVEKELARNATSKISLIVGAHSHTFLYTGEPVPGPDPPMGPYPTVVENFEGKRVLVVQASSYSKYLGNISVFYDKEGNVEKWEGAPIFLDKSLAQDEKINQELKSWKEKVDQIGNKIIGSTLVRLEQTSCSRAECLMGNFITDAMIFGHAKSTEPGSWTRGSVAMIHASGLRSGIDIGNITYVDILTAQPFKNTIDIGEIKGSQLKEILETSVSNNNINLLQVSGLKVVYNLTEPDGSKVISIQVRCQMCEVPIYEELEADKTYRIILPSFLADGGLGYTLIKRYLQNRQIGELDLDVFIKYIECKSPIFEEIEGRIEIIN